MRTRLSRGANRLRGHALTVVLLGMVAGGLGLASMWSLRLPRAASILAMLTPDGQDVAGAMQRAGLTAETLAASGAQQGDVATIVDDATTYVAANHAQLLAADAAVSDARGRLERYSRLVRSGTRDQETVNSLAAARSDLATAESSRQTLLDGVFDAATAGLEQGEVGVLTTLRSQRGWTMPVEYLCSSRSEAELLELRNAVAHKRIRDELGEDLDPEVQTLLNTRDGETAVTTARENLDAHLASVRTALESELDF